MADYKQLCAELVDAIDSGIPTDRMHSSPLMLRAHAALAEPKSDDPTTQELKTFACEWWRTFGLAKDKATCHWVLDEIDPDHFADFARDVLVRWGRRL